MESACAAIGCSSSAVIAPLLISMAFFIWGPIHRELGVRSQIAVRECGDYGCLELARKNPPTRATEI